MTGIMAAVFEYANWEVGCDGHVVQRLYSLKRVSKRLADHGMRDGRRNTCPVGGRGGARWKKWTLERRKDVLDTHAQLVLER